MIRNTFFLLFGLIYLSVNAQPTAGTTGLLNIPTANMQKDGTFMTGANYLPVSITPPDWDYNTANYYLNITFLPFMEVCYRMTLLKLEEYEGFSNQDRSISLRLNPIRERKYFPAIVVGFNDLMTSKVRLATNRYFSSIYLVSSKNVELKKQQIGVTVGYFPKINGSEYLKGFFYGISVTPAFIKNFKMIAEYDTRSINAGATLLLFNHLSVFGMAHNLRQFAGGFSYFVYLSK